MENKKVFDIKNLKDIKKLKVKPGKKYILFFPQSAGIRPTDLINIKSKYFADVNFVVESTDGIKYIEVESLDNGK